MFNSWHHREEKVLICSIWPFLYCKYSHHDQLQATTMMSLITEMGRQVHSLIVGAGVTQFQHGTGGNPQALKTVFLCYEDFLPTSLLLTLQSSPNTLPTLCPRLVLPSHTYRNTSLWNQTTKISLKTVNKIEVVILLTFLTTLSDFLECPLW